MHFIKLSVKMKNLFPIVFALYLAGCSQPKETIEYWRDDEGNSYPVTVTQEGEDTIYNFGTMVMTSDVMTLQKDKKEDKKSFKIIAPMGHSSLIEDFDFNSDGTRAVTVGMDQKLVMWDLTRDREIFSSQGHSDDIVSVDFSPDDSKVITSSRDKSVCVWDANDGTLLQTLRGHIDMVGEVFYFHKDNNKAVSIVRDRGYSEVFVWDLISGSRLYEFSGNEAVLSANDCVLFVANSDDDIITSYSMITGYKLKDYTGIPSIDIEFPPSKSQIYTLNIDESQQRIISSGGAGVTVVWDISSTEPLLKLDAHKSRIFVSEFSPKSEYIFTAGDIEGTVKLWDAKSGQLLFQRQEKGLSTLRTALFSSDGKYVAYIISGGIRIINLETFEVVVNEDPYIYYDLKLSLTKDPNIFAIEISDKLCFFEFGTGKKTKELSGHVKAPGLHSLGFLHKENTMEEHIVGDNYIFSIDHPEAVQFFEDNLVHASPNGKVGWVIRNKSELLEVELPSLAVKNKLQMPGLANKDSDSKLQDLKCSDKYIFLEYNDSIFIHERKTYKPISKFSGRNLALSNDPELIGFTTDYISDPNELHWAKNSLLICRVDSGDTIFYRKTNNCFTKLNFSSDVKYLCTLTMSGYYNTEAYIFDIENKVPIDTLKEDTGYAEFARNRNFIIHPKRDYWDSNSSASLIVRDVNMRHSVSELMGSNIKYETGGKYFTTNSSKAINIYASDSLTIVNALYSDSPLGDVLLFNSNSKKLVSTGTNRSLIVWDTQKQCEIYSIIILEKNNWLIQIPNSPYYMSSPDALSYLCFSDYKGVHCADEKFDKKYNKPRIVLKEIKKYFPEN